MHTTYILESVKNKKYYIGSTDNLAKRLNHHNHGYSRYTKGKGPFMLIYKEDYLTRSEAKKREYYLKSLKSRTAIERIIKDAVFV